MKLKKFKERDNKRIGIIVFTIVCILLVSGVIFYRTFAIFEVKINQNVIKGKVGDMGDLRFMVYIEGELQKDMPQKNSEYSLDTSKSYCEDVTDSSKRSHISWNQEKWSIEIKDISTTKTKCYLYFDKLYVDSTINGAIPDLGNELVAITFDGTGHALKADLTKDWYNYGEQRWANAVILRSKQDYAPGQTIPEENIESYFVWIPRYEYEIWKGEEETNKFTSIGENLGEITDANTINKLNQQKAIKIQFVTKNDAIKNGSTTGSWLTHPAFTSFNSNGFWVGKFETGYNQDAEEESKITPNDWSTDGAQVDQIASDKVIIKPNVYSWRSIRVANAFYTTYNYKRNLDSHMMKNIEWGAVAYLTNSKYGRCDGTCTEVRINNSSSYVTGSSALNEPTCGYTGKSSDCNKYEVNILGNDTTNVKNYNNMASVVASTTNNYYGVFDMAGGSWEYVMGVMVDKKGELASGRHNVYNSNFVGTFTCPRCPDSEVSQNKEKTEWTKDDGGLEWPEAKYYDTYAYAYNNDDLFQRGLFGDGTKEFGPFYEGTYNGIRRQLSSWHADDAFFVHSNSPWFLRGGAYAFGTDTGTATVTATYGDADSDFSFRVILTP